ncbi:regulator of chromosome condensation 1/beta-lactamase-inhibitor protein II [Xylaria sp. FL0064]|nr:regulator of chromosome condensation 1/beta-lactamase-inhibitor protein II [Xylaria sp. FL0064]
MTQTGQLHEMHLYATGFNAWRQLEFLPLENSTEEPDDIASFQKVLSDKFIEVQYASLTYTIVNTSTGLRYAGFTDREIECGLKQQLLSSTVAIAGNGLVAIYDGHSAITQHASHIGLTEAERKVFSGIHDIIQLVAYETGLVALARDGKVWTWGDERYSSTLGREVTISRYEDPDFVVVLLCKALTPLSRAENPGLVEDLQDLPSGKIKKIAAAGYTVLALTEGHDLYAWGGHPARQPLIESLSGDPSPVDVEENDILDFSVGETHLLVLTTSGNVYTIGENTNGQLGLPLHRTAKWTQIPLSLPDEVIVGVKAGQRSSFIVTKDAHLA